MVPTIAVITPLSRLVLIDVIRRRLIGGLTRGADRSGPQCPFRPRHARGRLPDRKRARCSGS
jgi:hypothetical protein